MNVKQGANFVEIENGLVKARFNKRSDGIEQAYFAKNSAGGWVPVVSAFRPPQPRTDGTAPLYSDKNVATDYRLLVANGTSQTEVAENKSTLIRVVLKGALGANRIEQWISLRPEQDHFHIDVRAEIAGNPPRLEYLLSCFSFQNGSPLDFSHAPCMKRAPDNVLADRVFHCPAVVLQKEHRFAALVPDLDVLNADIVYAKGARPLDGDRPFRLPVDPARISMPTALDVELKSGMTEDPLFSYGFVDYLTQQHMYWRHENANGAFVRELSGSKVHYGFDLFVRADAPKHRGFERVSRFTWERYGSRYFREPKPQALPFAEYAKFCLPAAFAYTGNETGKLSGADQKRPVTVPLPTWLEFELDGRPVGGIRCPATQWYHDIQFMAWWNNVRDAVGLYWWSERVDPDLKRRARLMVNLALSAPQREGIFPAVFNVKEKRWVGCYWKPSAPYDPSILPKYWDFKSDYYQTASASKTAFYLLRYRRLCEDDARILPFLRSYGEFVIRRMDPNGCLPAWFTPELSPVPNLRFNAEGGIHICFLTELFKATGERKYLAAAERIAGFLAREILPQQRWYDFETFYSCASKPEGTFDAHTGQWPRCTLSMIWAADGLGLLHKATRNGAYLEDAVAVADYMTLYQSVWQPHFIITAYAFGGCLSQNSDAEWLDMRQPLFAEALVRLARLTGRQDYYERGVAALRASFAMVNHPLHVKNKIFPTPNYPPGLMPENIDHEGIPQLPLRSGFDWAEGGALSAAATIVGELGGAYMDPARKACVGVDGVLVKGFEIEGRRIRVELQNQLAALTVPYNKTYAIELRIPGLAAGNWQLVLNSGKPRQVTAKELERLTIEIEPRAPIVWMGPNLKYRSGLC